MAAVTRSLYWLSGDSTGVACRAAELPCYRVRAAAAALRQPNALSGRSSPHCPGARLPLLQESQTIRLEPVAPAGQEHCAILLLRVLDSMYRIWYICPYAVGQS